MVPAPPGAATGGNAGADGSAGAGDSSGENGRLADWRQLHDAVLVAPLGRAVAAWRTAHFPGDPAAVRDAPFLVDVEGHGREEIAEDLDLAHTVGWFTSMFPVRLEPGDTPHAVQRRLDRMPDKGLGFGPLRYLNPET
ncbi:hypothetical protein K1Y78_29190 [Streptomyces sp. tea 10]|nr:hypothetical protein [Streptomyces sp. tea 10]